MSYKLASRFKIIAFIDDVPIYIRLPPTKQNMPNEHKFVCLELVIFIVLFFRIFLRFLTSMRMSLTNYRSVTLLSFRGRLLTWWHLSYKRVRVKVHLGIHIDHFHYSSLLSSLDETFLVLYKELRFRHIYAKHKVKSCIQ